MVLKENKQYHEINKYIIAFINNCQSLSKEQKSQVVSEWKNVFGSKLKSKMYKCNTRVPRRRISTYLYFCEDERIKIRQENPSLSIRECTCILGQRWREFQQNPDPDRLAKYTAKSEADKQRYEEEKIACAGELSIIPEIEKKRPKSAYLNYCAAQRAIDSKISMKNLSIGWKAIKENPDELAFYKPKPFDSNMVN